MHLTVYLSDGGKLDIADFDQASALDLKADLESGAGFLTFDMDGATVFVNPIHVVRIDVETGP